MKFNTSFSFNHSQNWEWIAAWDYLMATIQMSTKGFVIPILPIKPNSIDPLKRFIDYRAKVVEYSIKDNKRWIKGMEPHAVYRWVDLFYNIDFLSTYFFRLLNIEHSIFF